jgi:oligopeptide/dipeptide ABC transporter ATP-binding protein
VTIALHPTDRPPETLIQVDGLTVQYGHGDRGFAAVEDVSFVIDRGTATAVIGETGSGKTTLMLAIMGLLPKAARVDRGKITFSEALVPQGDGTPLFRSAGGRSVAIVFQDSMSSFDPNYTIGYQIAEVISAHSSVGRRDAMHRAVEALRGVGLRDAERVAEMGPFALSGGMRQRAMIAMARVCDPQLIIADEPTTALDPISTAEICRLLNVAHDAGVTLMVVTHDLRMARAVCDQVVVLYRGVVVEVGMLAEVLAAPKHPYTAELIGSLPGPAMKAGLEGTAGGTPPDGPQPAALLSATSATSSTTVRDAGCRFARECGYTVDACLDGEVPLSEMADGRKVRCLRAGGLALRGAVEERV